MTEQIEHRVRALEMWQQEVTTGRAVDDERRKHMDAEFKKLEGRFDKVDGHISRLLWLVIAAIVAGAVNFIMSGGMNVSG